jgi:hypothetical protein
VLLLQASGLQADSTLNNYSTVAALLGSNSEANFTNYTRYFLPGTSITVSVNTGTGTTTVDVASQVWNAAGGALNDNLGALVTFYKQTSVSLDSVCLPLTKHDFVASTTGGALDATISSIGSAT